MKNFGFTKEDLCKVYRNIVRPVADYCAVVYHSMLSNEQDELLDQCQAHALRCIFGKDLSYAEMRKRAGVTTFRQRRIELCDKFAKQCPKNPRFARWFPVKTGVRASQRKAAEIYQEKYARCDRLKNSPVFYMRRRLNGKEGKVYGEKYRERRGSTV